MSCEMVHPAVQLELHHDRVNPGVASAGLFPGFVPLLIDVPVDLLAQRIAHHLVEVGGLGADAVEELAPQQLPYQGHWRLRVLLPFLLDLQSRSHKHDRR